MAPTRGTRRQPRKRCSVCPRPSECRRRFLLLLRVELLDYAACPALGRLAGIFALYVPLGCARCDPAQLLDRRVAVPLRDFAKGLGCVRQIRWASQELKTELPVAMSFPEGHMKDSKIQLILGGALILFNIAIFATGSFLLFHCLPKIASGEVALFIPSVVELKGANAFLAVLFVGAAMMIVSLVYTYKAYTECASPGAKSVANIVRNHCPQTKAL